MATEDEARMALQHMHTVIESTLLNSLESSGEPSQNTRNWVFNVSWEIINDLNHSGWGFWLNPDEEKPMTDLRTCIDCIAEGVPEQRFAPYPGPRCAIHQGVQLVEEDPPDQGPSDG